MTENKAVFGSVNADAEDWLKGSASLAEIEVRWPGLLARSCSFNVPIARFREALDYRGIRATIRFATGAPWLLTPAAC